MIGFDNALMSQISLTWSIWSTSLHLPSFLRTQDWLEHVRTIGKTWCMFYTFCSQDFDPRIRDLDHSLYVYLVLTQTDLSCCNQQSLQKLGPIQKVELGWIKKVTRHRTIEQVKLSIQSGQLCASWCRCSDKLGKPDTSQRRLAVNNSKSFLAVSNPCSDPSILPSSSFSLLDHCEWSAWHHKKAGTCWLETVERSRVGWAHWCSNTF